MNYGQYKITYEYQAYNEKQPIQKTEYVVLLKSDDIEQLKSAVNTYRLAGFERASINVRDVKYIKDVDGYIINVDVENNDLSIFRHTETFFSEYECVRGQFGEDDIEEILENLGYKETTRDNSYNWRSDYSDDIDFKVYQQDTSKDWVYDEAAFILVRIHKGLDARAGYEFFGLYKNDEGLGENMIIRSYISVWLTDNEGKEVDQFDGDYAIGSMLESYTLTYDSTEDNIKVKCNETGDILNVNFY